MARRKSVEDKLGELDAVSSLAERSEQSSRVEAALADTHYRVVAKAASLAASALLYELVPALSAAFPRLVEQGPKRDPSCHAKKAIARALVDLDCDDVAFFLDGLRLRQLEPVYGGSTDTAAEVRCHCAMGLVASGHPRALVEVAELLNDPDAQGRVGAVRAISCGNPREAELLLRAKALHGDHEPEVLGECFTGLLAVEPDESPAFVARFLDRCHDETIRELAALALGESRLPAALDRLQAAWDDVLPSRSFRRALLRASALHRSEAAFAWLLAFVADGDPRVAEDTLDALAMHKRNATLTERVRAALGARKDSGLGTRFEELWR